MTLPPIKAHYQRFEVRIVTQQAPNKITTTQVPARTAKDAVDSTVNGGARELGRYDWTKVSCDNESTERPPHRGGPRQ